MLDVLIRIMGNNRLFPDSFIYLPSDIKGNYNRNNKSSCFLRTKEKPSRMKKRKCDCDCTLRISTEELVSLGFTKLKK